MLTSYIRRYRTCSCNFADIPAQQSLIPFDSEVTSHLGAILGRSRSPRIINGGRRITRVEGASIIIAPAGRSPVCNSATRFRGGIAVIANGTEMPDNNVASAPRPTRL